MKPRRLPPSTDWSGLYAGVHFGYAAGRSDLSIPTSAIEASLDPDGFIGGIHIGVNQEMANRFVLGAEADIAYSNVDSLTTSMRRCWRVAQERTQMVGSARLRAGYALDRTMPYITAGVAAAKYEVTAIGSSGAVHNTIPRRDPCRLDGSAPASSTPSPTGGSLRVEYRYSDFGSKGSLDRSRSWHG